MSDINKVVVDGVTYDIGGTVSGVKGDAESSYRTGNVNLTPANIGAKSVQSAVSSPSASGTAVAFIDTISQDAQGVITATKKTVREATVDGSGLMTATQVSRLTYVYDGLQTASDNFAPEVSTYPIKAGALFIRHNSWSTLTDSAGWHLCRALVDITSASGTTSDNKDITYEEIKVSDLYEEVYALALAAYPTDTASGSAISITDGADGLPVKSLVVDIEPVQSGSGDPSPTNVRAISGWTGAQITVNSDVISITFPTEAGTVYGGTLDLTAGTLTVDRANIANYAGETLPGAWISSMDVYTAGGTPTTGAQVVYELANPVTYQLTPQEVTTILGNNTIYADTGDVTVIYRADPTLFASKGQTEDDMTANAAIASGAYFQIGNTLYKATAAIATGETIVPGTNCTVTNIAEALNLLNA